METKSEVRVLKGHTACVSSATWCKGGSKVVTSGYDCNVILWDLNEPKIEQTFTFKSEIILSQANPRHADFCLVCPYAEVACILDLKTGERYNLPITRREPLVSKSKKVPQEEIIVASWNKKGDRVYVGNSLGLVSIITFDVTKKECQLLKTFYLSGASSGKNTDAINQISFSKRGKNYLVLSGEKIKLVDSETDELIREFKDVVNSTKYGSCGFSGKTVITDDQWDSDYVIAHSGSKISIWDRITELETVKDQVLWFDCHPYQAVLVTSTRAGLVTIWGRNYKENWSAFAPDFLEMEENEFYIEKEDEFDVKDENEENNFENQKLEDEEEEHVDINTIEKSDFYDSDVSETDYYIPIFPKDEKEEEEEEQPKKKKKK